MLGLAVIKPISNVPLPLSVKVVTAVSPAKPAALNFSFKKLVLSAGATALNSSAVTVIVLPLILSSTSSLPNLKPGIADGVKVAAGLFTVTSVPFT